MKKESLAEIVVWATLAVTVTAGLTAILLFASLHISPSESIYQKIRTGIEKTRTYSPTNEFKKYFYCP